MDVTLSSDTIFGVLDAARKYMVEDGTHGAQLAASHVGVFKECLALTLRYPMLKSLKKNSSAL